jgi:hypothetical protein
MTVPDEDSVDTAQRLSHVGGFQGVPPGAMRLPSPVRRPVLLPLHRGIHVPAPLSSSNILKCTPLKVGINLNQNDAFITVQKKDRPKAA